MSDDDRPSLTTAFEREHSGLLQAATELLTPLKDFRRHIVPGRIAHMQHDDFAERALSLSLYLSSAVDLARRDQYLPAFAVLRSALEHHLTDQLLFLATRYKQVFVDVKKETYQEWMRAWEAGESGTETIISIEYQTNNTTVIRSGPHATDETGKRQRRAISIYYFLLREFDPFVGRAQEQQHLSRGFSSLQHRIEHATEQQQVYGRSLRWDRIKDNLSYNRLCSMTTLRQLEVHYRFLSAFVHPVPAAFDEVYGRNRPSGAPRYDHYASELVLLYAIKIASEELKALKRMAGRAPRIRLADWDRVEAAIRIADARAEHLWFPGGRPHAYDYVEEANSRGLRNRQLVPWDKRPSPKGLKPSQVRYYRNPLRRLIKMHSSFQEMTGFAYVSPWPREDARFR